MKVGTFEAGMGERKSGYLHVGETALGKVEMPITIIEGSKPGPTLAMTGGFHPREYAAIESLSRIARKVDPKKVRGGLIIVHIVNTPGFEIRGRKCPIDDAHPINSFPGDPEGTISQRIAHTVVKEVFDQSDYYIDHHSNDIQWTGPSNVILSLTGSEIVDAKSEAMGRCFKTEYLRASKSRGTSSAIDYAVHNGIPSCLTEVGSMMGVLSKTGVLDEEAINWNIEGVENVMKLIGMIDGKAWQSTVKPITNVVYLRPNHSGLFYPLVEVDKRVSEGQPLAEIRDPFGNVKETLYSPFEGVTSLMSSYVAVKQGIPVIQLYEIS